MHVRELAVQYSVCPVTQIIHSLVCCTCVVYCMYLFVNVLRMRLCQSFPGPLLSPLDDELDFDWLMSMRVCVFNELVKYYHIILASNL